MYSDGYKYWLAYKTNSMSYYRCFRFSSSIKCPGRCVSEDGKIKITAEHNHPREVDKVLIEKFRKILTYRAATEKTELYAIYCDEATSRHSDAAMLYPFTSAESAMRKARRKKLPKIPNSIDEIIDVLNNSSCNNLFRVHTGPDRDSIYQKTIHLNDSVCMIFMHRKTYELYNRIEEILVDGSFEFIPQIPPNFYLLTIHAVQGDITAPIVYAILTAKTQSAYSTFFAYLREELHIIPNVIMSDFDHLMQTSLAYTFPEAIIKGCWFHYTDAVLSKMKNLNLQRETAKGVGASGLRMLLVLPLLPAEYMTPGLESLKKWLKEKNIFSTSFSKLCDYVENNWLRGIGAEKMSIFGTTRILANHTRNFNKELSGIVGNQNPVIWIILDSITQLATKIYVKINKKMKSIKVSQTIDFLKNSSSRSHQLSSSSSLNSNGKSQKKNDLVTDTIISSATQLWIKTPVHLRNPLQFLQLSSHCINDSVYLSKLSDIKEKVYSKNCSRTQSSSITIQQQCRNSNLNIVQQQQQQQTNSNCWSNQQQQLQQQMHHHHHHHHHQQQQQQQSLQQNHLETDLPDLSLSVNFLDHQQSSHLDETDYGTCSLGQEFILSQPQNHQSLTNLESINNQNTYSCFNSCNVLDNQTLQQPPPPTSQSLLETQFQQQHQHQQHQQHQLHNSSVQIQRSSISSNPPPLAFFPAVKRLTCKRRLPLLSEPPPLVPIQSKTRCKQ